MIFLFCKICRMQDMRQEATKFINPELFVGLLFFKFFFVVPQHLGGVSKPVRHRFVTTAYLAGRLTRVGNGEKDFRYACITAVSVRVKRFIHERLSSRSLFVTISISFRSFSGSQLKILFCYIFMLSIKLCREN